jgi:hypothetical protein
VCEAGVTDREVGEGYLIGNFVKLHGLVQVFPCVVVVLVIFGRCL